MKRNLLPIIFAIIVNVCYGQNNDKPENETGLPVWGIKTNLLYDATATFNLGAEFRLGDKLSLDLPFNLNPFTFSDNRKWKHFLAQPELRWWTDRPFTRHFFGLHAHYAYYNVGNLPKPFSTNMKEYRYEGWLAGAGIGYGYRWNFDHKWGLEAELGVGYAHLSYDKYLCGKCGEQVGSNTKNYFGPTKAALSLIYSFGGKKKPVYVPPVVEEIAPYIPRFEVNYLVPAVEKVKIRAEEGKAYLDFVVDQHEILPNFKNNAAELQKIHELVETVKNDPDATATGISIVGYASPEAPWDYNLALSRRRAHALKSYIQSTYGFADSFISVDAKGEDWATLEKLVEQSSLADKNSILEIIRGNDDFDSREERLKALSGGKPYRELMDHFYPQLRRSDYRMGYTVVPFTIEKGKEVMKTRPGNLSLNEMFLIANTYEPGSDAFNKIFETAARLFPDDDTAALNAAANALSRKEADLAERHMSATKEQIPSATKERDAAYHNNMGILKAMQGKFDEAEAHLKQARESGSAQATHNLSELAKLRGNGNGNK